MRYLLSGEPVNGATLWTTLVVRGIFVLAGVWVLSAVLPWTFVQVLGVVVGLALVWGSKTLRVDFADKRSD